MELIDTHCHLTFDRLECDIEDVLERSKAACITKWIVVGTDSYHNSKAVELTEKFENVYAAVGIHPHEAGNITSKTLSDLKMLAQKEKVVAIGETGLDFHYNFSSEPDQRRAFESQLHIAVELNLPVIIHSREAFDETIEILERFEQLKDNLKGVVFHCFSGSAEQAGIVFDRGYYISLTGVVTFKNAESIRRAAKAAPLNRLMLETDCPYMSPEPVRKQKINEPALMIHTAEFLAKLKNMSLDDFADAITANSKTFFGLP